MNLKTYASAESSEGGGQSLGALAFVTVTFNPSIELLKRQLDELPRVSRKLIVDNSSDVAVWKEIESIKSSYENLDVLLNRSNLGLAAAINKGAERLAAEALAPEFIMLLDQDSVPRPKSIEILLESFVLARAEGKRVGSVGPMLLDPETGLTHGFHQMGRFGWRRLFPAMDFPHPVSCANLNGSGTLVELLLFRELGGLDESLFIDHVDTEWSFRVLANGFELLGVPRAVFLHNMGESSKRLWIFGWRIWPLRSPKRHYFLYRNAIKLMRRPYVPVVWKIWAAVKLFLTSVITLLIGPSRWRQLRSMIHGLIEGLKFV